MQLKVRDNAVCRYSYFKIMILTLACPLKMPRGQFGADVAMQSVEPHSGRELAQERRARLTASVRPPIDNRTR
jgi:hypothetical protein